jgi:Thrombospondin type 1 domain
VDDRSGGAPRAPLVTFIKRIDSTIMQKRSLGCLLTLVSLVGAFSTAAGCSSSDADNVLSSDVGGPDGGPGSNTDGDSGTNADGSVDADSGADADSGPGWTSSDNDDGFIVSEGNVPAPDFGLSTSDHTLRTDENNIVTTSSGHVQLVLHSHAAQTYAVVHGLLASGKSPNELAREIQSAPHTGTFASPYRIQATDLDLVGADLTNGVSRSIILRNTDDGKSSYQVLHLEFTALPMWKAGAWGTCSAVCGGGSQSRTLKCQLNGADVASDGCLDTPPATSQACNTEACGAWVSDPWTTCSAICGGGNQTRANRCQRGGVDVDTKYCLDAPPTTSQTCNNEACGTWVSGDWGTCSAICGGGSQTRTNHCQRNGVDVDASYCITAPPAASQACNTAACATWVSDPWGACSAACEQEGIQTRTNRCQQNGVDVDANLCFDAPPETSQDCMGGSCTVDLGAYHGNGTCGILGVQGPGFTLTAGPNQPLPVGTTMIITGSGIANIGVFSVTGGTASVSVLSATSRQITLTAPLAAGSTIAFRTTLSISVAFTLNGVVSLPTGYVSTGGKAAASVTSTLVLCSAT